MKSWLTMAYLVALQICTVLYAVDFGDRNLEPWARGLLAGLLVLFGSRAIGYAARYLP